MKFISKLGIFDFYNANEYNLSLLLQAKGLWNVFFMLDLNFCMAISLCASWDVLKKFPSVLDTCWLLSVLTHLKK